MKNLINKIKNKRLKVGVIGLGYVGLEILLSINEKKFITFGFDKDALKIENLKKNIPTISTIKKQRILNLKKNFFYNLKNISNINNCDVILICVPTPLNKNLKPDMSYVKNSIKWSEVLLEKVYGLRADKTKEDSEFWKKTLQADT